MNKAGITTFFLILLAVFVGVVAGIIEITFRAIVNYPVVSSAVIAAIAVYYFRKAKQ